MPVIVQECATVSGCSRLYMVSIPHVLEQTDIIRLSHMHNRPLLPCAFWACILKIIILPASSLLGHTYDQQCGLARAVSQRIVLTSGLSLGHEQLIPCTYRLHSGSMAFYI